jgi:hypothetical protein
MAVSIMKERRRLVQRFVVHQGQGADEQLTLETLTQRLQQEVQYVREEQPDLKEYQLYDLTFSFRDNGLLLQMEFRR